MLETKESSPSKEIEEQAFLERPRSNPKTIRVKVKEGSDKGQVKARGSFLEKFPSPPDSMLPTNPSCRIN